MFSVSEILIFCYVYQLILTRCLNLLPSLILSLILGVIVIVEEEEEAEEEEEEEER